MESLSIVGNGGVSSFQSFARLETTNVVFRPRTQLGFGCFVRESCKDGNLVIARSGRSEVGNSKDGNFAVENEKEEKGGGGLILGPERDASGSVIGFNLIPDQPDNGEVLESQEDAITSETEEAEDIEGVEKVQPRVTYNIIFVTSEAEPYSKTGGLGDVCGSLPIALAARGHRVMVVSPRYLHGGLADENFAGASDLDCHIKVYCFGGEQEVSFFHEYRKGVDWVFVDHPSYHRPGNPYGDIYGAFGDNQFRFALLCHAACEAPLVLPLGGYTYGEKCLFLVNDWHAGLVPVLLASKYHPHGVYKDARSILMIHNLAHQREISVMRLVRHPNIVELKEGLATKTKIFFIMEYVRGGELFAKVAKGRLKEEAARKYFQQLISAIDYCHNREQLQQDGLLHTQCGTRAYVALEVLRKKGYDGAKADIWSCEGVEPAATYNNLGLPPEWYGALGWVFPTWARTHALDTGEAVNVLKGAIVTADRILTVSKGYAWEITTVEGGYGLHELLSSRRSVLNGITNGIDIYEWNPSSDKHIASNYSVDDLSGKVQCKIALQKELGLPIKPDCPLIGFIGRLDYQKGIDLIRWATPELMEDNVQFVMLGSGDPLYEEWMRATESTYKDKFRGWVGFNIPISHKITAGADILLMPSRFEPCGLNQLYAMRYGTVPVVHGTGGLRDTVQSFDPYAQEGLGEGTGWIFSPLSKESMLAALRVAIRTYRDHKASWEGIMKRGMEKDYTWENAAVQYEQVFEWAFIDPPYIK